MKIVLVCSTLTVGIALSGCALEPGGPSPYGYAGAPYDTPGASSYWSSPYYAPYAYAPYAPYGYAGSTLGFGFGGEGWHERDRDWRRHDHDWHREGTGAGHHHAEPSVPGSGTAAPPTHAAPPPAHAAPARPAPPSASAPKEKPLPPFHGSAF